VPAATSGHRRQDRRRGRARAVVLAVATCGLATLYPAAAAAGSTPTLAPGRLVKLSDPGIVLSPPRDGRLVGPGFSAEVLGAAQVRRAGAGGRVWRAPSGDRLEVFSMALSSTDDQAGSPVGSGLMAAVEADGQSLALPTRDLSAPGTYTYALAVTPGTDVVLTATDQGVNQGFSLTGGARVAPQVLAYYRNPTGPTLTDTLDAGQSLTATDPTRGVSLGLTITLRSATLDFLAPDGTPAPAPGDAFVKLHISQSSPPPPSALANSNQADYFGYGSLPPDRLHLELPGAAPIPAQVVGPDNNPSDNAGMFAGTYYFAVPANITTARLVITPGSVPVAVGYDTIFTSLLGVDQASITGSASFALDFPDLPPPAPPLALPPAGATKATPASGQSASSGAGSGGWLKWLGLGILVAVAAAAVALTRRRHGARAPRLAPGGPVLSPPLSSQYPPWTAPDLRAPTPPPAAGTTSPPTAPQYPPPIHRPSPSESGTQLPQASPEPLIKPGLLPPPAPEQVTNHREASFASRTNAEAPALAANIASSGAELVMAHDQATRHGEGVEVLVLGPVEVIGWAQVPARRKVSELLAYLVLHRNRPLTGEELRTRLWPLDDTSRDVSAETFRSYVSMLRQCLGGPELLPEADAAGYRLGPGVTSDWERFQALVARAEHAEADRAIVSLHAALSLVRGAPFAATPAGSYEWASAELHISHMTTAIAGTAHRLADLALAGSQAGDADWAVRQALSALPDFGSLYDKLLRAAAARGDRQVLDRVWADAHQALRDDAFALAELSALHESLQANISTEVSPDGRR
jgi:hypothetical protein